MFVYNMQYYAHKVTGMSAENDRLIILFFTKIIFVLNESVKIHSQIKCINLQSQINEFIILFINNLWQF